MTGVQTCALPISRDRLTSAVFQRSVINAEMFGPQAALAAGFLDQVVAPDQLMATAEAMAQQFRQLNMAAHTHTKRKARKALLDTLTAAIEIDKLTGLN